MGETITLSEIKLVYPDWLMQKTAVNLSTMHGEKSDNSLVKLKDWSAHGVSSSLQNVYFDDRNSFAGIDWH